MNLDKYIKIKLIELSKTYELSLIEISTVKEERVYKNYIFNYKNKDESAEEKLSVHFNSKRQLVSWLLCLK